MNRAKYLAKKGGVSGVRFKNGEAALHMVHTLLTVDQQIARQFIPVPSAARQFMPVPSAARQSARRRAQCVYRITGVRLERMYTER